MNSLLNRRRWQSAIAAGLGVTLLATALPAEARIRFVPPSGLGVPGRRVPGGSRGNDCLARGIPLTALVPRSNVGLTTMATPTLFVYVPQTSASQFTLTLWNPKTKAFYKQTYQSTGKTGVLGFRLSAAALEVGNPYNWTFSVVCDPRDRSQDEYVQGTIQRVTAPQLSQRLQQSTLQQRAALYAEAGIWQDSLTALAELRQTRPMDAGLKADWDMLLSSTAVGLDHLVRLQAPILLVQAPTITQTQSWLIP